MPDVTLGALKLALPPEFELQSAVFIGPADAGSSGDAALPGPIFQSSINVTTAEREIAPAQLVTYVAEQIKALGQLSQYKVIAREDIPTPKGAAILVHHRFEDEGTAVEQLQLYFAAPGTALIVTVTGPSPLPASMRDAHRAMLVDAVR